jgi:hypothetical protein
MYASGRRIWNKGVQTVESLKRQDSGARPSKLVDYCCVFAGHWKKPTSAQWTNTLTIQQGGWAFCPFNVLQDGHEWAATGGITVDQLRRMVRRGTPAVFTVQRGSSGAPARKGARRN